MIELPSIQKKPVKNFTNVNTISSIITPYNSIEVIENIHDIVEKLQHICSQINSYFGKKVRDE